MCNSIEYVNNKYSSKAKVYLPVSQGLHFRPLLLIDGFISLNKGEVGLWCDMGRPSVSRIKEDDVPSY